MCPHPLCGIVDGGKKKELRSLLPSPQVARLFLWETAANGLGFPAAVPVHLAPAGHPA